MPSRPPRPPTAFEQSVYEACSRIPRGKVSTYAQLAQAIGCGSPRAIGQALKKNPNPPHIPCHRVVASDRALGGFNGQTGGHELARKRALLAGEGVALGSDGRVPAGCVWSFDGEAGAAPRPSITTRGGDDGSTRLFSGERVSKASARPEAYGDVDELVSQLGVARSLLPPAEDLAQALLRLQDDLFTLGAELATTGRARARLPRRVDDRLAAALDARCQALEAALPPPTGFILPGATTAGAVLDVARAIARRLERKVVALHEAGEVEGGALLRWVNRLSDYLWLLARRAENGRSQPRLGAAPV